MLATGAAAQNPESISLQDQITQHEQKLSQARAARNLKEQTSELVSLGTLHEQMGETQRAEECFNQALQIWRKVGNRNGEALALNDIGRAMPICGVRRRRSEFFNQALPIGARRATAAARQSH